VEQVVKAAAIAPLVAFVLAAYLAACVLCASKTMLFNMEKERAYAVFVDQEYVGTYHTWYTEALKFQTPPDSSYTVRVVLAADTSVSGIDPRSVPGQSPAVFPNPCGQFVSVWAAVDGEIVFYDVRGIRSAAYPLEAGLNTVPVVGPAGVYFYAIKPADRLGKLVKI
jgi:hypothetical protein